MSDPSLTRPYCRRIDQKFTNLIINYVKENPPLYAASVERKNPGWKKQIWSHFAQKYNLSVQDCQVRWKSIRDNYLKNRKRLQEGRTTRPYEYAHLLYFLDDIKPNQSLKKPSNKNRKSRINSKEKPIGFSIEKKMVTVNLKKNPNEKSTYVEVPVHQPISEKRNVLLDTTEVNIDTLMHILEMRKKEEEITANIDKQLIYRLQEDSTNEEIPVKIHTDVEDLTQFKNKMITFQVPTIKYRNETVKSVDKPNICVPTEFASLISNVATEEEKQITKSGIKEIKQIKGPYKKYSHLSKHKKVTKQQLPNNDNMSCIESQYKETEKILKEKTDTLNQNLEPSKESTERYFDEMGEYVHNRFPKDIQQKLKMKIWSLIVKNDTAMLMDNVD